MRPFLAGMAALVAISAWNWVMPTARETWSYTRYWAMSFLVVLLGGLALLVQFEQLSKEQCLATLIGIGLGTMMGTIRVVRWLANNEKIPFP
jgi:hypothetical protein